LLWHSRKAALAERGTSLNESGPPQAIAPGGPTSTNQVASD
jgi:hypothetical protein